MKMLQIYIWNYNIIEFKCKLYKMNLNKEIKSFNIQKIRLNN